MRYDKNFAVFGGHSEWYEFVDDIGYVPTEEAPEEAKIAMKKYNNYLSWQKTKRKRPSG